MLYFAANVVLFVEYWISNYNIIQDKEDDNTTACGLELALNGTKFMCPTYYVPWAKAFGQLLNFNCAFLLMPILRKLLQYLNSFKCGPTTSLASYVPLRKNVIFHKSDSECHPPP